MEVFGHQDVHVEEKVVGAAGSFDDLFEDFLGVGGIEVGEAVVATEGDEVDDLSCDDVQGPGAWLDFNGWERKADRASARWPTHAMKLHEWGTRGIGWILCMGHPPARRRIFAQRAAACVEGGSMVGF
jgi:hypothetical protein